MRLLLCCVVVAAVVVVAPNPCPTTTAGSRLVKEAVKRCKEADLVFEAAVVNTALNQVQVKLPLKGNVSSGERLLTLPCHLNATISRYIIFAQKNFIVESAIPSNAKVLKAVKKAMRKTAAKADVTKSAKINLHRHCVNNTASTSAVDIICKYGDVKKPTIVWLKNNVTIRNGREKYRIKPNREKKQSVLKIRKLTSDDADSYECRVTYKGGKVPPGSPGISIKNCEPLYPTQECDILYCHNNGSCKLYEQIGEYVCECADGYNGRRCENKIVGTSPRGLFRPRDVSTKQLSQYWGKK